MGSGGGADTGPGGNKGGRTFPLRSGVVQFIKGMRFILLSNSIDLNF